MLRGLLKPCGPTRRRRRRRDRQVLLDDGGQCAERHGPAAVARERENRPGAVDASGGVAGDGPTGAVAARTQCSAWWPVTSPGRTSTAAPRRPLSCCTTIRNNWRTSAGWAT